MRCRYKVANRRILAGRYHRYHASRKIIAMLNSLGTDKKVPQVAAVTLPAFTFKVGNHERETREDEQHRATIKVIKQGQDAWGKITEAESFEAWKKIGAALSIGKAHALRVTGANQAWGQHYSREFCIWMNNHGFSKMLKSTRSHAIDMFENIEAIERWRAMLSDKERR